MSFKCPTCGIGQMTTEIIPDHHTKLNNIPIHIKDARISRCDHCHETSLHARELKRWEKIQQEQLKTEDVKILGSTTKMIARYWEENGKICVQNFVGTFMGQYHEHTPGEFEVWRIDAEADGIEVKKVGK